MPGTLERELLDFVVGVFQQRVLTGPRGAVTRDLYVRERGRRILPQYGGFLGPAAAFLARTKMDGNPYYGREDLLQLALDAGDRLVADHLDVGRKQPKPNHFTIYPLAELYETTHDIASAKQRGAWRETMARNLKCVLKLIERTRNTMGKPYPWSGTGPNHFFGWFAVGLHQALLLHDRAAVAQISHAMRLQMRIQAPGGYFPEQDGPVVLYHNVSLGGLAEFHRLRPSAATKDAIRRGADYLMHCIYPNLHCIETIDMRNRYGYDPGFQPALAWTPLGRRLLGKIAEYHRRHLTGKPLPLFHPSFNVFWTLGAAFRAYQHAADPRTPRESGAERLPIEGAKHEWRLESKALVRKAGPWFYTLSAYKNQTVGNPYHLDRTQALSIYHDRGGLIVGGGNDKRAPEAATIHVVEEREVHYFPPVSVRLSKSADALAFDYGSTQANLTVHVDSDKRLRVQLNSASNMVNYEVTLVFQLPIKAPLTFKSGGRAIRLKAGKENEAAHAVPLGGTIELPGKWRMRIPRGSTLHWPHLPWASYRPPTYRAAPNQAVALLRMPLSAPRWKEEVIIDCK
jgi:hypothetical protein